MTQKMDVMNDITVSEFKKIIDTYADEICCNGKTTGSHSYPSSVSFNYKDCKGEWHYLRYKGSEPDRHMGCNCWTGIEIELEEI